MDSYYDKKGRLWTACHECRYSGKGDKSCNIGRNVTYKGILMRGCWAGDLLDKAEGNVDEIHNQ